MNHKQMLDKMRELEARIKQLEQQAHFHAPQPIVPQPAVPQPPWVVTCSNPQDAFELGSHQEQQASWHETTRLDPRYRSESLT